jgi:Mitochondrial sulfhydryl oxidase involved in the biogenesis of cytosolic Fe/S proteins
MQFVLPLYKNNSIVIYGPKVWYLIHLLALGYVERESLMYHPYQAFIMSIKELLPCKLCRDHFIYNMTVKYNLEKYTTSSSSLFLWSYLMHNEVNETKHKVSPSYTTCLEYMKTQLHSMEMLPNLFYALFTLVSNSPKEKLSYIIMLVTSLKYLIPEENLREIYIKSVEQYGNIVDFTTITPLYWVYLIYQNCYASLGLYYYSYNIILKHFHVPV